MVEAIPSTPEKSPHSEHINWACKWAMDLHGTKQNYTSTPIKILGVVQEMYRMDETPFERGQCHYTWSASCGTSSQLLQKWSYKILRHNSAIFMGSESIFACHKNVFNLGGILRDHNRSHSLDYWSHSQHNAHNIHIPQSILRYMQTTEGGFGLFWL